SADAGADAADASDASGDARDSGANRLPTSDCVDNTDPSTANFQCVQGHCLYPCPTAGSTVGCRAGRICMAFGPRTASSPPRPMIPGSGTMGPDAGAPEACVDNECYCTDGPDLASQRHLNECLGELLPYQVGVGHGFSVVGSQTASPATGTTA